MDIYVQPRTREEQVRVADDGQRIYDDGLIACDEQGLLIRRYYPWGPKRVPYGALKGIERLPLTEGNRLRRWRLWGSGDFVHWWNLDPGRLHKDLALVLDIGRRILPTITPDDPEQVERILRERLHT